jgi:hypothetical protein
MADSTEAQFASDASEGQAIYSFAITTGFRELRPKSFAGAMNVPREGRAQGNQNAALHG